MNDVNKEKLSIKEIARLAGTSVATVSRVINQKGRYSRETEQRVLDVIREYDYRPNMLAKSLREDRMKVIGLIVTDLLSDYFVGIIRAIEQELTRRGYIAVLCDSYESEAAEKHFMEVLGNLRFSGIIYVGGKRSGALFNDVPVVYVDRAPDAAAREKDSCYIGSDNYRIGYLATEALLKAGRRDPAIVMFEEPLSTQAERLRGYRQALKDHGIPFKKDRLFHVSHVNYESGQEVTREIIENRSKYDSVFYTSDILAIGGLQYMTAAGMRIPEDMALIGVDDIPRSARVSPGLTTIRQHYLTFGTLAANAVVTLIEGGSVPDRIMDVELVRRGTV